MYKLYSAPGSAAMAPTAALEEIGAAYELVPVDISMERPRDPEYLELNPNGWVPTLVDENGAMYESAAIMIYLADKHPEAGLAPPAGDGLRGRYLQWLVYMADTLQIAFQMHYYPERHSTEPGDMARVQAKAAERLASTWAKIDVALDPGPYMLGERFSGCDIYVYMLTTWHPDGSGFLETCPNVARLVDLVTQRPAVRRMMQAHGII